MLETFLLRRNCDRTHEVNILRHQFCKYNGKIYPCTRITFDMKL